MINQTSIVAVAPTVPCRACDGFTDSLSGICECCEELGVFVHDGAAYYQSMLPVCDKGVLLEKGYCSCGNFADATDSSCRECEESYFMALEASHEADDFDHFDSMDEYDYDDGRFEFQEGYYDEY